MRTIDELVSCFNIRRQDQMFDILNHILGKTNVYRLEELEESETEQLYVCTGKNEVLVLLADNYKGCELADEMPFNWEKPLYFSECRHRVSPVFRLYALKTALSAAMPKPKSVAGVFLTATEIINYEDMIPVWDAMDVIVKTVGSVANLNVIVKKRTAVLDKFIKQCSVNNYADQINLSKYEERFNKFACAECPAGEMEGHTSNEETFEELPVERIIDKSNPVFQTLLPDGTSAYSSSALPAVKVYAPLRNPEAKLEKLVGLDNVKDHLASLTNMVKFKRLLEKCKLNAKCPSISLHSVFVGNPGTGKTSVAVLYASLLHKAGVLSGGNVIIANRGSFLGRWVGTEEKNVNMVLEMGKGNLIMIDEAHTLAGANPNDFSRNVLPMFMTALADENNRDFAVVLCGYEKEMDKLMNTDPGLASRFPNKFVFEDFLPGQLYAIGCGRIKDNGYHLENDAAEKLEKLLLAMYGNRTDGWANAREIATVCEKILIAHADRCVKKRVRGEGLLVITEDDIPEYVPCKINVGVSKIGFNRNK